MSNRKELRTARRNAEYANAALAAVEALPRQKGSLVAWANGVVWRRVGDNAWEPLHKRDGYTSNREAYGVFPSLHVATYADTFAPVVHIKELPKENE